MKKRAFAVLAVALIAIALDLRRPPSSQWSTAAAVGRAVAGQHAEQVDDLAGDLHGLLVIETPGVGGPGRPGRGAGPGGGRRGVAAPVGRRPDGTAAVW